MGLGLGSAVCSRTFIRSEGLAMAEAIAPAVPPATIFFQRGTGSPALIPAATAGAERERTGARTRGGGAASARRRGRRWRRVEAARVVAAMAVAAMAGRAVGRAGARWVFAMTVATAVLVRAAHPWSP